MARVGLVTEGPRDFEVLSAFISAVWTEVEIERIHPPDTPLAGVGGGWKAVRAWCLENGARLEEIMHAVPDRQLDVVIVHVDCSMAHNIGIRHHCPPADRTGAALRDAVRRDWLVREGATFVVVVTPSRTLDIWLAAALEAGLRTRPNLECNERHALELRNHGVEVISGRLRKAAATYRALLPPFAAEVAAVCTSCTQAQRFRDDLGAALAP